ncbi:MAG: alpha/beta fold hydrolase [Acidobacteriota bacterium]
MPYVLYQGRKIYYEESGSGPAIVLGHSFLCSTEMWSGQVGPLSERHRVINIDYRGHGRSDPAYQRFSLDDLLGDVLAVLDHLGVDRAIWAGLSTGGMVALRAALSTPERVRALVLMDTDAGAERSLVALKYRAMVGAARIVGIRPLIPQVLSLMFGTTTQLETPELVEEWRPKLMQPDLTTISHWVGALVGRVSLLSRLQEIRVPTQVIVGAEDRSLPPALSRRLSRAVAGSQLVEIPAAGHLSALERPEAVNRAMIRFLDGLEGTE